MDPCLLCILLPLPISHVAPIKDVAGVHFVDGLDDLLTVGPFDVIIMQILLQTIQFVEVGGDVIVLVPWLPGLLQSLALLDIGEEVVQHLTDTNVCETQEIASQCLKILTVICLDEFVFEHKFICIKPFPLFDVSLPFCHHAPPVCIWCVFIDGWIGGGGTLRDQKLPFIVELVAYLTHSVVGIDELPGGQYCCCISKSGSH